MAALYLGYMGLMLLACTAVHGAMIFAWFHVKWTSAKPLPDFLHFPAAELLLLNLLALPAAMYAMLLMVQAPASGQRVLGAIVFSFILAYMWFMSSLLLFIVRHKTSLGLCAVDSGSSGSSDTGSSKLAWSGFAEGGYAKMQHKDRYIVSPHSDMSDSAIMESTAGGSSRLPSAFSSAQPLMAVGTTGASDAAAVDLVMILDNSSDGVGGDAPTSSSRSTISNRSSHFKWWGGGRSGSLLGESSDSGSGRSGDSMPASGKGARHSWSRKQSTSSQWQLAGSESMGMRPSGG